MYSLIVWIGCALFYISNAFALFMLARSFGEMRRYWWALIPVIQLFLLLRMAERPWWWFAMFLIPVINLVVYARAWTIIAGACGRPVIWGILTVVPLLNLYVLAVLAFSKPRFSFFTVPTSPTRIKTPQGVA